AQLLGLHGGQNVHFLVIGQGAEYIGVVDILFPQQAFVGCVAVQYRGPVETFGQRRGPAVVAIDQFDLAAFFQFFGEARADVAAAGNHDPLDRARCALQFAHDFLDVRFRGDEENRIVGVGDGLPARHHRLATAVNGNDTRVDAGQIVV